MTREEIAKARFKRLSYIRIGGVLVALLGVAIAGDKIALPHWLGVLLVLIGTFDVLVFPTMLIRRWKKEDK
jgi:drug/metabolite transporter (DMT)-like permease